MVKLLVPHPQNRCQSSTARLTFYVGPARVLNDVLIEEADLLSIQQPGAAKFVFLKTKVNFGDIKDRAEPYIQDTPTVFLFDSVPNRHVASLAFELIDRGHKVMAGLEVASVRGIGYHIASLFDKPELPPYFPKIFPPGAVTVVNLWQGNGTLRNSGVAECAVPAQHSWNGSANSSVRPLFARTN
jgi:hypothetical protein